MNNRLIKIMLLASISLGTLSINNVSYAQAGEEHGEANKITDTKNPIGESDSNTTTESPQNSSDATSPTSTRDQGKESSDSSATLDEHITFEDELLEKTIINLYKQGSGRFDQNKYSLVLTDKSYKMPENQNFITKREALLASQLSVSNEAPFDKEKRKFVRKNKSITSIKGIESFTNLEKLMFNNNDVKDLSPVEGLKELKELKFRDNKVSDLSSVKNLSELKNLTADSNEISDLTPIKDLKNLDYLNLKSNKIKDISPIKDTPVKQFITLNGNYIKDLSVLKDKTCKRETSGQVIIVKPQTNIFDLKLSDSRGGNGYTLSESYLKSIGAHRVGESQKYRVTSKKNEKTIEKIENEYGDLFGSEYVKAKNKEEGVSYPKNKIQWYVKVNTQNIQLIEVKNEEVTVGDSFDLTDNIVNNNGNIFEINKVEDITETKIDTKKPGQYEGKIKITYNDGDTQEVSLVVTVKNKVVDQGKNTEPSVGEDQGTNTQPSVGVDQGTNTQPSVGEDQGTNTEPSVGVDQDTKINISSNNEKQEKQQYQATQNSSTDSNKSKTSKGSERDELSNKIQLSHAKKQSKNENVKTGVYPLKEVLVTLMGTASMLFVSKKKEKNHKV
ncbi:leucine-rich repeat domain-containing protein [Anaerococcus tetradius]|uniref:leucine-rich repeat domain-containing protein n=1 Tax=Anaerococcus tetradius TaxID=33036 RepID=UPI0023F1287B|nr:leucine-rich repeat domain-containing protein [Anaerococcus tetradius]